MGKYIVITGASTGIGLAAAKKFAGEGCHVFGSVRSEEDGDRVKQEIGALFTPLLFDVTNPEAIAQAVTKVEEIVQGSGIACLVNNAGIAVSGVNTIMPIEDYRKQFEVNFFGAVAVTQAFLPLLGAEKDCAHPPGKIINISSVAGQLVFPFMGPYSASKHALEGYSHALRRELMLYGIDVVIVAPGAIKTPIWGKSEELDEETLASDYGPIVSRFRKIFLTEEKEGLEVEVLADKLFDIFKNKKPKTRYAILNKKFTKWTLPRYILSDRALDKFVKKLLKL